MKDLKFGMFKSITYENMIPLKEKIIKIHIHPELKNLVVLVHVSRVIVIDVL
jgi:hypothetical protein